MSGVRKRFALAHRRLSVAVLFPKKATRVIDVRLYAHLSSASSQGSAEFQVEARPGLTVRDVVAQVDIAPEVVHIVRINHERADLDAALADRDRLGLFPAVSGG